MSYRLFDFGPSPFCIKIRSILDHKRVGYERVDVVGPALVELTRRGRIGKVPAFEMGEELVCDSTDIAYALEARHPEPAILPRDPRQRALCHLLEEWADESLYWLGVYYRFVDLEGRADTASVFSKNLLLGRALAQLFGARARAQLRGQGTGRKPPAHVARDLGRQLEHLSSLLEGGSYLLEETPLLCDFALSAQLLYLSRTPVGGRRISEHERIVAFMKRMKGLRRAGDGSS